MTYDFHGGSFQETEVFVNHNAPLVNCYDSGKWCNEKWDIASGIRAYLSAGVPASKLVLGLGTYGRTFKLTEGAASSRKPGVAKGQGKPKALAMAAWHHSRLPPAT